MSAHDVVIDPALRDLPPPTPHTAGVKRKGRGGANAAATTSNINNNNNNVTAAPISDRTRVTRRSAALLSAAQHLASPSDLQQQSQQRQPPDMEPTRGEEENKYQWTPRDNPSAKRSRHRSPSSHALRSGSANAAASGSADGVFDPALAGAASSSHASPGLGGIDNLAAAAAVFQSNPLPYPYGLTPFRYPCLTPHLPQPSPGDPHNPDFVPFDHTEGTVESSSTTESSTTMGPFTSMSRHTSAGAGGLASGSRPGSRPPSSSGHAADPFTSFSTLLAASEAHSTYHSPIAGSQPPSHRQTPEPRLR